MPANTNKFYTPLLFNLTKEVFFQLIISIRCLITGENIFNFNFFRLRAEDTLQKYPLLDNHIKERIKKAEKAPRKTAVYRLVEAVCFIPLITLSILPFMVADMITFTGIAMSIMYRNLLSPLINRISEFFEQFVNFKKPAKSSLRTSNPNYVSNIKNDIRKNSANARQLKVSFDLPRLHDTFDNHIKLPKSHDVFTESVAMLDIEIDRRAIKKKEPGYRDSIRQILVYGKNESLKSQNEEGPILHQYQEVLETYSHQNITPLTLPHRIILAGRFTHKC